MKAHAKILRDHPVFSRFSSRTINRLTAHSQIQDFPAGTVVCKSGDLAEAMYVILSGRCQAQITLPDGSEQILDIYAPGDTFGERALVSGDRFWGTVSVITDCVLLRVAAEDVNYLFDKSPKLARELVLRLVDQLNAFREERTHEDLGRVAAFVELAREQQASIIARNVAVALAEETGGSVLYVHLSRSEDTPLLLEWPRIYERFNDEVMRKGEGTIHELALQVTDDNREPEILAPMIGALAKHFRYVVAMLDAEVSHGVVTEFVEQSDLAYILPRQQSEDLYRASLLLRDVQDFPKSHTRLYPMVCLDPGQKAKSFAALDDMLGMEVHGVIPRLPPASAEDPHTYYERPGSGQFRFNIRRMAREIGRCQVGLALSSGGAKSFAHVGVIQVLEEHGIHVDVIAGTSMGAYVGALWAFGLSGMEMAPLAQAMGKPWAFFKLIDPALPPRRGFIRGNRIEKLLRETIGSAHFSDLVRPLRVVSTDLDTLERIVFDSGEVAPRVHASLSMPGVFVPMKLGGRTLVDGGVSSPMPVDVLIQMGVERIIAVNTIMNVTDMSKHVQMSREMAKLSRAESKKVSSMGRYVNYFAPGNILDVIMRGIHGTQTQVSEGACQQADVVLRPVFPNGKWNDFENAERYIELGRRAAEEQIDKLKSMVHKVTP